MFREGSPTLMSLCTHGELLARLARYGPQGLHLRSYFHGFVTESPTAAMRRAPELVDDEGLGAFDTWSGFVESVPFCLRGQSTEAGWGLEIALPVPVRHGRADDRLLLDAMTRLPMELARWDRPYWTPLPFRGHGYAVVPTNGGSPIFCAPVRDAATRAAAIANARHPPTYHVAPIEQDAEVWLVVGPTVGSFVSRVEVAADEGSARRLADRWQATTGVCFEVRRDGLLQ